MTLASALIRAHIRERLAAALALPIVALAASSIAMAGEPVTIRIDNFTFGPETVTVAPGTKVIWINGDDIPHTVVSQTKLFRSKALDTDDRYTFTFDAPGEYPYFCSLHPHMTGKVVVKAPAG
ncbi:cupredoxin family copper-binding protein [Methylobacterium sp. C25]|uniref:cupredoxin domain-containing protein n=1 Tax=Methylobacterium sp. C25 TaxID=2721622 RepID=UPI001F1DAEC4|nr:cupredoxin family copper-binding protein [Methylobacterium sp. C25]MCE4226901.1 cupredoxin family copper-binding protein [Methylobacterium sp. C25]